jgi:hypothetical protein
VALDLEIGNTIHNFESGGEIKFIKAHGVSRVYKRKIHQH